MKTLILTIWVSIPYQVPEVYHVETHEVNSAKAPTPEGIVNTVDGMCQVWAEKLIEVLQYGAFNSAIPLPGSRAAITYRIDECSYEI